MRAVLAGMAVAVLTTAAGGVAGARDEKIDAKLLVGKWVPKDKEKDFTVEFTKDGKINFVAGGGKDLKIEGTYKLDGNKLSLKMKFGDDEKNQTRTITKLTKTELVSRDDEKGKEDTLVRVGDKKE
jgi:uncharacterized protein (TIGR03066 family)